MYTLRKITITYSGTLLIPLMEKKSHFVFYMDIDTWDTVLASDKESILQSRDITLPTKVRLVKAMVFPVVMYGCESWTIKKAIH